MSYNIFQFLLIVFAITSGFGLSYNRNGSSQDSKLESAPNSLKREAEVNFPEIMAQCNESFRISYDDLREYNNSGSLPDETDRTPMCFIKCYLEKSGILVDGVINRSKTVEYIWPATGDSIDACEAKGDDEQCVCRRAYAIAKCMMTRALVDAKNKKAD